MDRLEAEVADLRKEIRSYMMTTLILLVSLIGGVAGLMGYLLWERNKVLLPLLSRQIQHEHRLERLEALLPSAPSS